MAANPTNERQEAHEYLDRLPDAQIVLVRALLTELVEPAECDADPTFLVGDLQRIAECEHGAAANGGKGVSMDEMLADFGLTIEDFPQRT